MRSAGLDRGLHNCTSRGADAAKRVWFSVALRIALGVLASHPIGEAAKVVGDVMTSDAVGLPGSGLSPASRGHGLLLAYASADLVALAAVPV
jgi:hypothetical protein